MCFGDKRLPQRFWDKVSVNEETGCWEWTAYCNKNGYGTFKLGTLSCLSRRVAYEHLVRKVDSPLQLDHLCRVRRCCNPVHLEPVTCAENVRRSPLISENAKVRVRAAIAASAAVRARKTHCPQGHPYDEANTYMYGNSRMCKQCATLNYERNKQKYVESRKEKRQRLRASVE